jgi:sulfur-oxidizing protein SoxX
MEWRLQDCFRQQRLPQLKFGSDVAIGLTMFLARNAAGGVMAAPSSRRCRSPRMQPIPHRALSVLLLVGVAGSCLAESPALDRAAATRAAFEAKKRATMERLAQHETQRRYTAAAGAVPAPDVVQRILDINRAGVKLPAGGSHLGDWQRGEKIAQTGSGLQFNDDPAVPTEGNCYACHELSGTELAFGTIGPSLRHYGKQRGSAPAMLEYHWGKLYSSNATTACSLMPRFGHQRILSETQLRDLMSLLFNPASPVSQ